MCETAEPTLTDLFRYYNRQECTVLSVSWSDGTVTRTTYTKRPIYDKTKSPQEFMGYVEIPKTEISKRSTQQLAPDSFYYVNVPYLDNPYALPGLTGRQPPEEFG